MHTRRSSRAALVATLVAVAVAAIAAVPASAGPADDHGHGDGHGHGHSRSFDLQAHRGGVALTVENTLPAFAAALELGVSTLELDVQITEDGHAVVTHDRDLSPAKCVDTAPAFPGDPEFPYVPGRTYVKDLTLAQVRTVDCGSLRAPAVPRPGAVARRADAAAVRGARPRERLPGAAGDPEHRAEGRSRRPRADRAARAVRPGGGGRRAGRGAPQPGDDPELRLGHADAHGRGGAGACRSWR